ncbi:oligopeptide transport system substrate-binding protein [Tissierella praeacuta DSM 18095]|uniref:Oligopeptide transport system substrate-binding protein n=1 Tax=Tissierella praeacuta DSM 18095 TaxID=1123404 RepID=A0A1M4TQ85_9FIRM|nr:peptide ABC transporter substrate-binding protein [Tissierella praeacuta]SHE46670.1 oligopeptide transport system substrate-binding protein [Tissierella praeacuta DSM 18095]SUP04410.1 76 kDa cell surface lipoprotein [Tissierella praeacuta]
MKRLMALMLAIMMIMAGCSTSKTSSDGKELREYSVVYSGEITTLNYLVTASTNEFSLAANMVDSLIDYDKYGVPVPGLATEWESSSDGLVWTLKIREGVKWVTYEGKEYAEVKAKDFVDAAKYLLDPKNESKTANIFYSVIKNAEEYYNGEIENFNQVGVKAVNDYTLEYTLKQPTPYFLSMLNYVCFLPVNGDFLEEVGDRFGTDNTNLLYNGAFIMETFEPQTKRILVANKDYWDKDNIFIDKIKMTYNKEAATLGPELFLREEIDHTEISASLVEEWIKDPDKKHMFRPQRTSFYTYFYALNFDPKFDAEYEPENWKMAVNNLHFRKSLFHALDRKSAMITAEPYNPEQRLSNTITPKSFVDLDGIDYIELGGLKEFSNRDSFNEDLAKEYRDKAMEELKGKVKFPVIVYMPYNSSMPELANRVQIIEQQMENLLGKDYIDIQIDPKPPTNFLSEVRRSGKYAFLECNWGPDYADPETYTDPFVPGGDYNFPEYVEGYNEPNGEKVYTNLVNKAKGEVIDVNKRYELFAEAEAFLIKEAFVIPYALGGGGYAASRLNPFESQYSPFGVSSERYKGQELLEKPMNTEEYKAALEIWEKEREEALKNSK